MWPGVGTPCPGFLSRLSSSAATCWQMCPSAHSAATLHSLERCPLDGASVQNHQASWVLHQRVVDMFKG